MTITLILICSLVATLLLIGGLGIKIIFKKNGEFKRHCSSRDPYTGEGGGCICGQHDICQERERHPYQPLDITETLMDEINNK